ncbi:hypothetical protein CJF32_00004422 [Rutstroemia sp. NJR-2017a WRK4]|nr:hypothetical protein CJF32_00004422 [Rutstroemia sp. NJR-2017a WRK4]
MAFYDSSSDHEGLPIIIEPDDDESLFEMRIDDTKMNVDTMKEVSKGRITVPKHPIASMQGAFAESMQEAAQTPPQKIPKVGDAATRRKILLDQDISEATHSMRWQRKPGQKYHELWKLMAQISFGIYLLLNGIAKDEEQVMSILQGHVDEVDGFLEMTLEDFDLAQTDIEERLKYLKLPLENISIFDAMLEDRAFRSQIVSGNEKIEHVITRTATAMKSTLVDAQQGMDACKEFTIYLAEEQDNETWRLLRPNMGRVFDAMCGNVEGWHKAYVSIQTKGNNLGVALVQLGSIVAEMDRRAAEISRESRFSKSSPSQAQAQASPPPHISKAMRQSMIKNLPNDPSPITPAIQATLPAFSLVQDRERSPEPEDSDSLSEEEEPEPLYTLKPHTYSPILQPTVYTPKPSPRSSPKPPEPTLQPKLQPAPEVKRKSSIRKRFSLKRKDEQSNESPIEMGSRITTVVDSSIDPYWGPRQYVNSRDRSSPSPVPVEQRRPSTTSTTRETKKENSVSVPRRPELNVNTPPSRGVDSAYCSDLDPPFPVRSMQQSLASPSSLQSPSSSTSAPGLLTTREVPPIMSREFLPSPRSDKQFFRPVNASPHSPLQRPWTAAPMNHNERTQSSLGTRPHAPSRMGMSMMSDMTTVTMEDGKKVKKKRSAFGWLKKAFSLSEEERAEYEERRRRQEPDPYYEQRPPRQFLDGKRIRG